MSVVLWIVGTIVLVFLSILAYGNYQAWKYDAELDRLSDEAIKDLEDEVG